MHECLAAHIAVRRTHAYLHARTFAHNSHIQTHAARTFGVQIVPLCAQGTMGRAGVCKGIPSDAADNCRVAVPLHIGARSFKGSSASASVRDINHRDVSRPCVSIKAPATLIQRANEDTNTSSHVHCCPIHTRH